MQTTPSRDKSTTSMNLQIWRKLSGRGVLILLNVLSGIAIFYEGYNQGVMGGVNSNAQYQETVGIGSGGIVFAPVAQGGIVAIYYFGALFGCFWGGYLGDKIGRKRTVFLGSLWALLGAALQAATQNRNWILCARVIAGIGIGHINTVVPAWSAELATSHFRGGFICLIFVSNYLGIAVAYWLEFGLSFTSPPGLVWRLPLAVQAIPVLILSFAVWTLPESPRWLVTAGRNEEALEILNKIRDEKQEIVRPEYEDICFAVESEKSSRAFTTMNMLLFGRHSGDMHLGRRAWLAICLQVMMEWDGITTVTVYAPTIFGQAGYSAVKSSWMSALLNSIGVLGTLVAAYTIDHFGRRKVLMVGAVGLSACLFLVGAFDKLLMDQPSKKESYGAASALFIFLFDFIYSSSWLMVPFIFPTEIFPVEVRAKGNAFGVAGWAIGCGWNLLLNPIMFSAISYGTFFLYACTNLLWIPVVYCFYPETARRKLEDTDFLFRSESPFAWRGEAYYQECMAKKVQSHLNRQYVQNAPSALEPQMRDLEKGNSSHSELGSASSE